MTFYGEKPTRLLVLDLAVNGDLDAVVRDAVRANREDDALAVAAVHAALAVAIAELPVATLGSFADLAQIECGRVVARASGGHHAGAAEAGVAGGLGRGAGEGAAVGERAAHGQDDAHRHRGGEDGSHGGDDSADGIVGARGMAQEPEEHVDHVDEPDRHVEVKSVTEHELPVGDRSGLKRLERTLDGKRSGNSVQQGWRNPVDADPVVLRPCDATLTFEERYITVETTADSGYNDLNSEKRAESKEDGAVLVVDGMDPNNMDSRSSSQKNSRADRLEQIEVGAG